MIAKIVSALDKALDTTVVTVCGWLGHEYIREANGFVYCRHCGHVAKDKD